MSAAQFLYRRFTLPSKMLIEVRRVEEGAHPEVVVREVNDDDELSPGEFNLKLEFVAKYGKEVRRV